jgi:uncharacterized protein (UPF0262 family)
MPGPIPRATGAADAAAGAALDPGRAAERLSRLVLEGEALTRLDPVLEADRAQAVHDLLHDNRFAPARDGGRGPYGLRLSITEGRLAFDLRGADDARLHGVALALGPFRRLIKDYQMLVDSHALAVQEGREARIQAIDMGRRGLHNEGAQLLLERLAGRVAIDFDTARRLFTLVCVLHQRI